MSTSLIPIGEYCYSILEIKEGEVLNNDVEKFGMELREFSYRKNFKEVLCPFWQKTQYGTVRCNYLNREFINDSDKEAVRKISTYFGRSDQQTQNFEYSSDLVDERKICGINKNITD